MDKLVLFAAAAQLPIAGKVHLHPHTVFHFQKDTLGASCEPCFI